MTTGQLPIAASSSTVTSSIAYATANTASTIVERDGSGNSAFGTITATEFTDGYINYSLAQINRPGSTYIEMQYAGYLGSGIRIGDNGSHPTTFSAYDGTALFTGLVTTPAVAINGDTAITAGPRAFMPFATGQLAAIVTSGQYFVGQLVKSGTVENFTATAASFTCATNPVLTLEDCGATAGTCSSPTAIANVTLTAANTITTGTITSGTLAAGHFFVVETTAGVCTVLNASGSAEYRMQ
jgi:hypothetical protein